MARVVSLFTMTPLRSPSQSLRASEFLRASRTAWSTANRSQVRHFHPTKPSRYGPVDSILDGSYALIQGVHSFTHLPWAVSIPLTALLVRMTVGFPLQIYTRRHTRREQDLAPITSAVQRSSQEMGKRNKWTKQLTARHSKTRIDAINSRFNLNRHYRYVTFAQIPVFIALMDALRAMCGNKNGLIPWILSLFDPDAWRQDIGNPLVNSSNGSPKLSPSTEVVLPNESLLQDSAQLGADTAGAASTVSSAASSIYRAVDPTLANEGAFWFSDLLAGDTTGILPFILTATIITNVSSGLKGQSALEISRMPRLQMYQAFIFGPGMKSFFKVMAVFAGCTSYINELPAALLIYWITSTNVATLQTKFLDAYMFQKPPIKGYVSKHIRYEKPGDPFGLKLK